MFRIAIYLVLAFVFLIAGFALGHNNTWMGGTSLVLCLVSIFAGYFSWENYQEQKEFQSVIRYRW